MISNDAERPEAALHIQVPVTRAVTVTPERIHFRGRLGDPLVAQVRLVPAPGHSMAVTAKHARDGKDIEYTLDVLPGADPQSYLLTVTCTRQTAGRINDTITLFTDSPRKPRIAIPVTGLIGQK